jgi:anaerobic magnesium-protoporphyrin IX monomethyl ester cyclase
MRRRETRQQFAAHFPALGLLNLAQSVRHAAAAGLLHEPELRYFDEHSYSDSDNLFRDVIAWLGSSDRRFVLASTYTPTIDYLETFLGRFDPTGYLIAVGGAHASVGGEVRNAHILVRGEGAAAIRYLLTASLDDEFLANCPEVGASFLWGDRIVRQRPAFDRSLEMMPSPSFAYDLLPGNPQGDSIYATNFTRMLGSRPQVYVCTQSCGARCTFCSTYLIHGRPVGRPLDRVRRDLEHLIIDLGHDSLEFHDDDLLQHPDVRTLCETVARFQVPWFCYARVDTITNELAEHLSRCGCRRVFLGLESMSQEKLDYFNKASTVATNRRAAEALAAARIGVVAGFVIGAPNDTASTVLDDLDQFLSLPLFAINCTILSPDPGTVEFHRARKVVDGFAVVKTNEGMWSVKPDEKRYGRGAPFGLPTVCKHLDKMALNSMQAVIDGAFYLREPAWETLTAERTGPQLTVVADYYRFIAHSLVQLADASLPSAAWRHLLHELKGTLYTPRWRALTA